jgi:hypothetical protein
VRDIAAHADGRIAVSKGDCDGAVELRDRDGDLVWTTSLAYEGTNLTYTSRAAWRTAGLVAFSRLGNVFVAAHECGGESWYLIKISPSGEIVYRANTLEAHAIAVDQRDGSAVVAGLTGSFDSPWAVMKFRWDGALLWTKELPAGDAAWDVDVGLDGSIVVAIGGARFEKWAADGRRLWRREAEVARDHFFADSIAVSKEGRIALAGRHTGELRWGDDIVRWPTEMAEDPSIFVLVADANGTPQWGKAQGVDDPSMVYLGFGAHGGPILANMENPCDRTAVRAFERDRAELRWSATIADGNECWLATLGAFAVAPWGEVLVGGRLSDESVNRPLHIGEDVLVGNGGWLGAIAQ